MQFFFKKNPELENKVNLYFKRIEEVNKAKYNNEISIILLGSLSRGEGSWYKEENTTILLSDIEYFTVIPNGFEKIVLLEKDLDSIANEVFGDNTRFFHVDNTFVKMGDLKKLEKKLLTFDANYYGRTVVGKDYIPLIPKVTIKNINYHDIFDILIHRAFSVLFYGIPSKEQNQIEEYRYSLAKNSLDLLTVFLIENNVLVSGFSNKCKELEKLNVDQRIKDYFNYCLSIKLATNTCTVKFEINEMESIFINLLEQLMKKFKYPLSNEIANLKSRIRRKLGIIKRMIKVKNIPPTKKRYLRLLISFLKEKKHITNKEIFINYVLNGYPNVLEQKN